jgi:hypothetical protein
MSFGICMLIGLYLLYVLLVKGALWKLILAGFGWAGMYSYLNSIPVMHSHPFHNDTFSWAVIIPTLIVMLAAAYTKEE